MYSLTPVHQFELRPIGQWLLRLFICQIKFINTKYGVTYLGVDIREPTKNKTFRSKELVSWKRLNGRRMWL